MKGRYFIGILGLFLVLWGRLPAQPYLIQGNIEHAAEGTIYLASYYEDRFMMTDSMESNSGSFHFLVSDEIPAGICRLVYSDVYQGVRSDNRFVEFIYNREDISLNVALDDSGPIPYFDNSLENQVYLEFMNLQLDYEQKLKETYSQLFPEMPGTDRYELAVNRYEALQEGRMEFIDSLAQLYPELYATRIMNAFRTPVVSGAMSHEERIDTLKRLFFEVASIDDPDLLYAPVYTYRLLDYLSLFRGDTFNLEQQELSFIEAVDRIMVNVAPVPELRSFVVEFLLEGFELLGMELVQLHLADHYLDESCESEVAELVRERMDGYKLMSVGAIAPDFTVRDVQGKNHTLSEMPGSYTLVIFWASTCQHCREMIPELKNWYMDENTADVEVIAFSIDSSANLFQEYISQQEMPWITIHDPLGWNGKIPDDYHIYATPSIFLLDRERRILARPVGFRQILRVMKKLGN